MQLIPFAVKLVITLPVCFFLVAVALVIYADGAPPGIGLYEPLMIPLLTLSLIISGFIANGFISCFSTNPWRVRRFICLVALIIFGPIAMTILDRNYPILVEQRLAFFNGRAERDETLPGRPVTGVTFSSKEPSDSWPASLRSHFGDFRSRFRDAQIYLLYPFRSTLKSLNLRDTSITDRGLLNLPKFTNLTDLTLDRILNKPTIEGRNGVYTVAISWEGLSRLSQIKALTLLDLSSSGINDDGVKQLLNCNNLKSLNLSDTKISDVALKELSALKNLTRLEIRNTNATEAGVTELRDRSPDLEILR